MSKWRFIIGLGDSNVADEATVVVGGAILEFALRDAIARHFRKDANQKSLSKLFKFECNGPLSDFASKIKIAYALGIGKEKTRDDLDKIRDIRNYFAHTPRLVRLSDSNVVIILSGMYVISNATLLGIAGLNHKQLFAYAVSRYHFALRTYYPNYRDPYPWYPSLP